MLSTQVRIAERADASATLTGSRLHVTVIRAGWNVSRSRYYEPQALQSGAALFEGAKMHADHPTAAQERERPEGSIRDWVATLESVRYDASEQSLRGTARIVDPAFREKAQLLAVQGLLPALGVSIRAVGAGDDGEREGARGFVVNDFLEVMSVDFVTRAGAGGQVLALESVSGGRSAAPSIADALRAVGMTEAQAVAGASIGATSEPGTVADAFRLMGLDERAAREAASIRRYR